MTPPQPTWTYKTEVCNGEKFYPLFRLDAQWAYAATEDMAKLMIRALNRDGEAIRSRPAATPNQQISKQMREASALYRAGLKDGAAQAREDVLDEFSELFEQLGNLHYIEGNKVVASAYYGAMTYTKRAKFPESSKEHLDEIKVVRSRIESLRSTSTKERE